MEQLKQQDRRGSIRKVFGSLIRKKPSSSSPSYANGVDEAASVQPSRRLATATSSTEGAPSGQATSAPPRHGGAPPTLTDARASTSTKTNPLVKSRSAFSFASSVTKSPFSRGKISRASGGGPSGSASHDSLSDVGSGNSLQLPRMLLNSSSPASELPTTWMEWQFAYKTGLIDFDDPPLPPMGLHLSASDYVSSSGLYRSPVPLDETFRQRAVDNLGLLPSVQHRASNASAERVYDGDRGRSKTPSSDLDLPSPKELASHPALQALITKANGHFGTCAGNVSLVSQDKVVYFAEQGLGGLDDLPRKELACDHTLTKASVQGLPCDDGLRGLEFGELGAVDRSAEGLIIPDLSKDWRFSKASSGREWSRALLLLRSADLRLPTPHWSWPQNMFGEFSKGFYAGTPIRLPSALGDSFPTRPCGVFCILSQQARTEPFTKQDRQLLANLADEAGRELLKVSQERAGKRGDKLLAKYEELKKASAEADRRASSDAGDDVTGGVSRRASEQQVDGALRSIGQMDQSLERAIRGGNLFERRASRNATIDVPLRVQIATGSPIPSNPSTPGGGKPPTTARSTASSIRSFALDELYNLSAESAAPVFPRRLARTTRADPEIAGVNAPAAKVSDGIKSSFDLSTRMICESLDFDFCYLLMINRTTGKAAVLSSHNLPLPPPLFHLGSHLSASTAQAVLYNRSSPSGELAASTTREEDEVASGLIFRLPTRSASLTGLASGADEKAYVLGAFSTDPRRVIGRQDLAFVKSTMPILGNGCDRL